MVETAPFTTDMHLWVLRRMDFERPDLQVKAFNSVQHEGFYIVTSFGFPCLVHVEQLDRWYGSMVDLGTKPVALFHRLRPSVKIHGVSEAAILDMYRRGFAGLVKHRVLGGLT